VNWGVQGPSNVLQGAREGIGGFAHEVVCSIHDKQAATVACIVNKPNMTHGITVTPSLCDRMSLATTLLFT
jgi:hypothetical protein